MCECMENVWRIIYVCVSLWRVYICALLHPGTASEVLRNCVENSYSANRVFAMKEFRGQFLRGISSMEKLTNFVLI